MQKRVKRNFTVFDFFFIIIYLFYIFCLASLWSQILALEDQAESGSNSKWSPEGQQHSSNTTYCMSIIKASYLPDAPVHIVHVRIKLLLISTSVQPADKPLSGLQMQWYEWCWSHHMKFKECYDCVCGCVRLHKCVSVCITLQMPFYRHINSHK